MFDKTIDLSLITKTCRSQIEKLLENLRLSNTKDAEVHFASKTFVAAGKTQGKMSSKMMNISSVK